jgi:hypothetical protein
LKIHRKTWKRSVRVEANPRFLNAVRYLKNRY